MDSFSNAPCASPVFYRTYSRLVKGKKESWTQTCDRTIGALIELGELNDAESDLINEMQRSCKSFPSGRWLWVGGSDWLKKSENYPGAFNCSSTTLDSLEAFGSIMELAAMGCGTGVILEPWCIDKLPIVCSQFNVSTTPLEKLGSKFIKGTFDQTEVNYDSRLLEIKVGDSRLGWVSAYQALIDLHTKVELKDKDIEIYINLEHVRPKGHPLMGFGGVANPDKLPDLFIKVAKILNNAVGRKLTSLECCLIIDEAALVIVAGNLRRSAGIRQFAFSDEIAAIAKLNLWQKSDDGQWKIDPERDALRMANHTRVIHKKPTRQECIDSVRMQYQSGEGAIQWAGEAVARGNADILNNWVKKEFLDLYQKDIELAKQYLSNRFFSLTGRFLDKFELENRLLRYGTNPCGEINLADNFCNLAEVPLNNIDPNDEVTLEKAFRASALSCCALLKRGFTQERYQKVREIDPIVAVSFTGFFDFCVNAFGRDWLEWWEAGRPYVWRKLPPIKNLDISLDIYQYLTNYAEYFRLKESAWLRSWKKTVEKTVFEYCDRHRIQRPNRYTTVQPSGTKSLLTNASPGWHPPKAARYIRRITFGANDPIALACIDYGYSVIPSPSDRDKDGYLLDDPMDSRVSEWLVEIPVAVPWAEVAEGIDIGNLPIESQFDFYMTIQQQYTTHNTSATLEINEWEIETLGNLIFEAIDEDRGYSSAAILGRFENKSTFPRLPFEPISLEKYQELQTAVLNRRKDEDFQVLLDKQLFFKETVGPAQCDSDKCLI